MGNMSYCRFRNTLEDFEDCLDNIAHPAENEADERARVAMVKRLKEIAETREYEWWPDEVQAIDDED